MHLSLPQVQRTRFFCLLAALLLSVTACADNTDEKLSFLSKHFENTASHSQLWQNGWFGLFSGVAALNAVAYTQTEGEHNRYDRKVGFVTSFLGAADLMINPMQTHHFAEQLHAMPQNSSAERELKLDQAVAWMQISAERERYEQSALNHILSGVVNGLAGLAVAYDDKRPGDGWVTFLTGTLASEVKIYTAPQQMTEAEWLYNSGKLTAQAAIDETPRWQIAAFGPLISATYRF